MKSKFVLFLTTIALFLTGCNSIKNENAIYAINNYDKQVISLSAKSITNMVKEKFSFNLLIYTESCSYCNTAKENIDKVQKQINYAIYELEINEGTLDYLIEELPSVFNREQIYPCLYIIDKGEVSYIAQYNELMNSSQIKKMIKAYSIDTNITTLNKLDSFNSYKSKHKEYLLFTYNTDQLDTDYIYNNYLFNYASTSTKNTLIIDKNTANTELLQEISNIYNTSNYILSIIENGQIKTTLEYEGQSGLDINNLFISFFNVDSIHRSR